MAFGPGKNGYVTITDVGGTQRNVTPFVDNIEQELTADELETTTYGAGARNNMRGFSAWTGTISGKWDSNGSLTPEFWFDALIVEPSGTVASVLRYYPAGSAAARPYRMGTVNFFNYSTQGPFDDIMTFSVDWSLAAGSSVLGTL